MSDHLLYRCAPCDRYTLRAQCPACGRPTRTPHPGRYRPGGRWGVYRRQLQDAVGRPRMGPE